MPHTHRRIPLLVMGRESAATQKLVLGKVQEAVDAANGAIKAVGIVTNLHNGFAEQMDREIRARDRVIRDLQARLTHANHRFFTFVLGLTFWQRLLWLLRGTVPITCGETGEGLSLVAGAVSTHEQPPPNAAPPSRIIDFDRQARELAAMAEQDSRVAPI